MGMHQGLDLSRFKKVGGDKKTTVLRHAKGHEIRIAHSGLTPKMREQLEGLPTYMADGGDPAQSDDADTPDAAAAPAQDDAAPQVNPQAMQAGAPDPSSAPASPDGAPAATPGPAGASAAPSAPVDDYQAPLHLQYLNNDNGQFAQDLKSGMIRPETYRRLFAREDTLGKIGTVFGMMLSGAGSGLAHQPNVLLEMMNKQFDRDLDAQKASNLNAQNWLRLSQQHEFNKAQTARMQAESELSRAKIGQIPFENAMTLAKIGQMDYQNQLSQAQAEHLPYENALTQAQGKRMESENTLTQAKIKQMPVENELTRAKVKGELADADVAATNAAINRMKIAGYQFLNDKVNSMGPGAQKDAATKLLQETVNPALQKDLQDSNAKTVQQIQQRKAMRHPQAPPTSPGPASGAAVTAPQAAADTGVDWDKFNTLTQQGQMNGSLGMPGGMTSSDVSRASEEAQKVQDNRAVMKNFIDSFDKLDKMALAGTLNPNIRAAEINSLSATIARETAGRFNQKEAEQQMSGMFPEAMEFKATRAEKREKAIEYFKSQEAGTPTLDRFGLKTAFPMVKIRAPDGSMRSVPQTMVKKYTDKGGKVVP